MILPLSFCSGSARSGTELMSLIEHLETKGWEDFFRNTFAYVLDVLQNDRFRSVGSAADDLRSWLAGGGISLVRERLNGQMEMRRFPDDLKVSVNELLEELVREHRFQLLKLSSEGIIGATREEWLSAIGTSQDQIGDLLGRMLAGERPFEDWMYAHGHTTEEIQDIYKEIDARLIERGIIPPTTPPWNPISARRSHSD